MSGLEVAAISLTVVEQILKLGFLTTELVRTAKDFDEDSSRLFLRTRHELTRTRQLKELLSTPISSQDDQDTPFSRFDAEIQSEIVDMFEQLEGIMSNVYRLVWGRYGDAVDTAPYQRNSVEWGSTPDNSPSQSSTFLSATLAGRRSSLVRSPSSSTLAKMRWAWKDKKKAEQLLADFNDMNAAIYNQIKLLLLSSTLGRDLEYCRTLERSGNAKALGLDSDVRLRIMALDEQSAVEQAKLEIEPWSITFDNDLGSSASTRSRDTGVSICKLGTEQVALEYKTIPVGKAIQQTVVARARQLAALLSQDKDPSFRVLQCCGYAHLASENRFAFLFRIPSGYELQPISLLGELKNRKSRPSLGDKFRLAVVLASSMAQLHMVQWVHKSFRSAKIVFFRPSDSQRRAIEFDKPFIFGFEYSRPENDFTAGVQSDDIENDIYRHPDRQGQPSRPFSKIHDIYALGVVLLEIGLWQPAIELEQNQFSTATDPHGVQKQLQKHAARRLKDKVGEKYTAIVQRCLSGDFSVDHDTKDDLKLQRLFREEVISVLEKITMYI